MRAGCSYEPCGTGNANRRLNDDSICELFPLVTNRGVAEFATRRYYDPAKKSFKRGAGSSVKGAARRLASMLNQFDLTFYLYGVTADELLALLPKEFDRFRPATK